MRKNKVSFLECFHAPGRGMSAGLSKAGGGEAQWILTAEEYGFLPAFKKSTEEEEFSLRYKATGMVQALGMRLKL
jgi:hypothetical protein